MGKKQRKIRVDLRKNRVPRKRNRDWTRQFQKQELDESSPNRESVSKTELTRRRTIIVDDTELTGRGISMPAAHDLHSGRVLFLNGVLVVVERDDGQVYPCAVSRVLRTIAMEERNAVAAGDRVQFRLTEGAISGPDIREPQGMIERVETRRGVLTRAYRGREQVVAANIDQLLIVSSMTDPPLKPNLIDRYIVAAEKGQIRPLICLNKADLVDTGAFQWYVGLYSQLGYEVVVASARSELGTGRLRQVLQGRATVLAGQSGVGKSSLLNAVEPGLNLRVSEISQSTMHGKHTTTVAKLIKLAMGGWVVDTPGIRQFELWDVIPEELEGYFVEFRPYVSHCRFPSCTHTHEKSCAVKTAVEREEIDAGRYERYLNLFCGREDSNRQDRAE